MEFLIENQRKLREKNEIIDVFILKISRIMIGEYNNIG